MTKRTPPPATHSHLPAAVPTVKREAGPPPAAPNPSLIAGWPGAVTLTSPSTAPGQPPAAPPAAVQVSGAFAKPGKTPPRRPRSGDV